MMCLCTRSWLVVLNCFLVCWSNAMVGGHCQQLRKASHTKWNYWEAILSYASYVYLDFPISRLFSCIVRRLHIWIAVHLLVHWNFPLTTLKIVLTSVLMLAFWLQTQKGQTHTLNHVHLKWEDLVLPDTVGLTLVLLQSMMSQTQRSPRHFVLSSYPEGDPEDEMYGNLLAAPDTAEQMEFNISSAVQVGHHLALIGDDFNRAYSRKIEDTLLHLAHGWVTLLTPSVFGYF